MLRTLWLPVLALALASSPAPASLLLVDGTLDLQFFRPEGTGFPRVRFDQSLSNVPLSVSSGGGFVEPAGVFAGTVEVPSALFTGVPLFNGLTAVLANGTKSIAPGAAGGGHTAGVLRAGGGLGGPRALAGDAIVNILHLFNVLVPLSPIGDTGAIAARSAGQLVFTVFGTGWTTAPVTITGITTHTAGGYDADTVMHVGYDNRTPSHAGVVQLVSPSRWSRTSSGTSPASRPRR